MREACSLVWLALVGLFRSRAALEAEILILRHQLNIQRRQSPKRLNFSTLDRLIFAGLYRLAPSVLGALAILKPETVIRWNRAGFRSYWRWRSRHRGGRPTVPLEIRELIREMSTGSAFSAFHRGTERLGCSRSCQQRILSKAIGVRFMIEHGCFVNCGQATYFVLHQLKCGQLFRGAGSRGYDSIFEPEYECRQAPGYIGLRFCSC
jgi:hypothetical protein